MGNSNFRLTLQTKILLKELLESPKTPYELRDKTHYFDTNIYIVLNRLVGYGMIERKDNKYCITDKGLSCIK